MRPVLIVRIYISLSDIGSAKDRVKVQIEPYDLEVTVNDYQKKNLRYGSWQGALWLLNPVLIPRLKLMNLHGSVDPGTSKTTIKPDMIVITMKKTSRGL